MHKNPLESFFLVGISYKKSNASIRSAFSLNEMQYGELLNLATMHNISEVFVLSTCNRTEFYGFAPDAETIIQLLGNTATGPMKSFRKHAYIRKNEKAVEHFFQVAAGLDSQILGDYEIIFQIKRAAQFAKSRCFLGSFTERLINDALSSSKCVKNHTSISNGITSTSYAAVQFLEQNVENLPSRKIAVVGAGKMGKNICKYLCKSFKSENITLINRTRRKADLIAHHLGIQSGGINELPRIIPESDVIIFAISAAEPVLASSFFKGRNTDLHVIDLSVPKVVEPSLLHLKNIHFADVDALSKVKDHTLQERKRQIPLARKIIRQDVSQFLHWNQKRKFVPYLKMVKGIMQKMNVDRNNGIHFSPIGPEWGNDACNIQKEINHLAKVLEINPYAGCCCLESLSAYLNTNKFELSEGIEA